MNLHNVLPACLLLAALACPAATCAAGESGWGSVKGRFIIQGDAPKPVPLFRGGIPRNRNDLVVDPKTKGIRHIFIYLRKAGDVHPALKKATLPELKQDVRGRRFVPHTMLVRTGQNVRIINNDPLAHTPHGTFFKNRPFKQNLAANNNKDRQTTLRICVRRSVEGRAGDRFADGDIDQVRQYDDERQRHDVWCELCRWADQRVSDRV